MWPMINSHKSTSVHKSLLAIRNGQRCYPLKGSSPRAVEEFPGRGLAGVGSREKVLVHSLLKLRKDTVLNFSLSMSCTPLQSQILLPRQTPKWPQGQLLDQAPGCHPQPLLWEPQG